MKAFIVLSLLFLQVYGGKSPHGEEYLSSLKYAERQMLPDFIEEDAKLDVIGLLTKYGYPNEEHVVETEDGYLLTVHRITAGKNGFRAADKPPVFIMHGLLSSSADWIVMGPENGLGYILADEGYDVWMGNARGNYYSRAHKTIKPSKSKFWKFSWNEIGYYDLPAMIDHVLEQTNKTKLHYIGHSQGTTSFFVMGSNRPEYNKKIVAMQALAPVAYMQHLKSPVVRLMAPLANTIELATSLFGMNEFLPNNQLTTLAGELLCNDDSIFQPVCTNTLFIICGFNPELLNNTMLPIIMAHTPAGSSSRQMVHYAQEHMSHKFRQYDHGWIGNNMAYGSLNPPKYSPKKVTAPVALHYSDNDWMAHPTDVTKLYGELGNPIGKFRVSHDTFNHLDFLWAIDVRFYCYNRVISLMKAFE